MVSAGRVKFAANKANGTFCQPGCASSVKGERRSTSFDTTLEALAAGFRPCKTCKPLKAGIADPPWLEPLMATVDSDPARHWRRGISPDKQRPPMHPPLRKRPSMTPLQPIQHFASS